MYLALIRYTTATETVHTTHIQWTVGSTVRFKAIVVDPTIDHVMLMGAAPAVHLRIE